MPELSIVIPSLQQADNLPSLLAELNRIVVDHSMDVETVISDDASEDETLEVAAGLKGEYPDLRIRVLHRYKPRRGYGAVVRYGLAHATGRFAAIVAANGQNPAELLPRMLQMARQGAHLVQCSRFDRAADEQTVPLVFRCYQSAYRLMARAVLGRWISDSTYGFKLFDRVLAFALGLSSNKLSLSPELTFKILLAGGQVRFVHGSRPEQGKNGARFHLLRDAPGYLRVLARAGLHRVGILWF
ncbi:MAG: glycosyltransferase family 2 protein [Bryobacterales bacterium]|nr:glycosyltransferase family 2 protein [Bryobacterales bacterium]